VAGFRENCELIIGELRTALSAVREEEVESLIQAILGAEKVFAVGVGRVLLSLQAFVKRLNHLGIRAWFVGEINEPAITPRDLLIIGSGSGESAIPVAIAHAAKKHGAQIALLGSNAASTLARSADIFVRIPVKTKLALPDEIPSRQIMSSLFEQCLLIVADAIALRIVQHKSITDLASLWTLHANLE
jgi:6-phospho-3-hexuloisomerase